MTEKDKIYIWLSMSGIYYKKVTGLLKLYPNMEDLWKLNEYSPEVSKILKGEEYSELIKLRDSGKLDTQIRNLDIIHMGVITIADERYPKQLRNIYDPPYVLYYCGDISLLNTDCIALVGPTQCTHYGQEQATRFSASLSEAGFTIVSGLAMGIDGYAHKAALNAGGKTIGVLAGGLTRIYPAEHTNLAREMAYKGLLITENPPGYVLQKYSFVQRNRIISGLSLGVLLPEAGEKCGALHTANFAHDQNRDVYALPGNVGARASVGTNNLIKRNAAYCVTEPEDIIKNYPRHIAPKISTREQIQESKIKHKQLSMDEKMIYETVCMGKTHYSEILEKTKLDAKKLNGLLTTMEIRGLIKKLPGNFFTV